MDSSVASSEMEKVLEFSSYDAKIVAEPKSTTI